MYGNVSVPTPIPVWAKAMPTNMDTSGGILKTAFVLIFPPADYSDVCSTIIFMLQSLINVIYCTHNKLIVGNKYSYVLCLMSKYHEIP